MIMLGDHGRGDRSNETADAIRPSTNNSRVEFSRTKRITPSIDTPSERFYSTSNVFKSVCSISLTLSHNFPRFFIVPQPDKSPMTEMPIWRPFSELDLCGHTNEKNWDLGFDK